jgi:hypothetical protein
MRDIRYAALVVGLSLALASSARAAGELILGDSLGVGVTRASGHPGLAEGGLRIRDPQIISQIKRVPAGATAFLVLGTNDASSGSLRGIERHIDNIVSTADQRGVKLIWLGPSCARKPWDKNASTLDKILAARLASTSVKYVSMRDETVCAKLSTDGIHMTRTGYSQMWDMGRLAAGLPAEPTVVAVGPNVPGTVTPVTPSEPQQATPATPPQAAPAIASTPPPATPAAPATPPPPAAAAPPTPPPAAPATTTTPQPATPAAPATATTPPPATPAAPATTVTPQPAAPATPPQAAPTTPSAPQQAAPSVPRQTTGAQPSKPTTVRPSVEPRRVVSREPVRIVVAREPVRIVVTPLVRSGGPIRVALGLGPDPYLEPPFPLRQR